MTHPIRPHPRDSVDPDNIDRTATDRRWPVVVILLSTVVLALSSCGTETSSDDGAMTEPVQLLSPADFSTYLDGHPDAALINVHIPYEGHIEGTNEFVPFGEILDWDALPDDRDTPIVLYCRSGNMSGQASSDLVDAGYTNIIDLDGGMNAWVDSGRTISSVAPTGSG